MVGQDLDLSSLVTRIEKLEQQQDTIKQYLTKLKGVLDSLTEQFKNRPEVEQLASLQREIAKLVAGDFSQQPLTNNASNGQKSNVSSQNLSDDELLNQFFDRVERQIREEDNKAVKVQPASNSSVAPVTSSIKTTNVVSTENQNIGDSTEINEEPTFSVEELLKRYDQGERNFIGVNLAKLDLSGKNFYEINLNEANLLGINLCEAELSYANLVEANLSGQNLSGINLCGANLSESNLSEADLSSADLRGANLEGANLEKANLKEAKINGANLQKATLTGATMPDGTTHE